MKIKQLNLPKFSVSGNAEPLLLLRTATKNLLTTISQPLVTSLPHSCLDPQGYVLTDPYLRMAKNNSRGEIYVYAIWCVAATKLLPISQRSSQLVTLKATLYHDLLNSNSHDIKMYKPSLVPCYVPISWKTGVSQTTHEFPIPGFVVSIVKARNFRLGQSKKFLLV